MTPGALAVPAAFGLEVPLMAEGDERRHAWVGHKHDIAAVPTIAAVGATLGHVLLTPERHAAGAAVAALHEYLHVVDEQGLTP
jgi:hypothetical protein